MERGGRDPRRAVSRDAGACRRRELDRRRLPCDGRDARHCRRLVRTRLANVEEPLLSRGRRPALLGAFLLVWANLAVGIVGSEHNPNNQLFFVALLMGIAAVIGAKARAEGMVRAMLTTAGSIVVAFVVAELGVRDEPIVRALVEIVGTSVFVALFLGSVWMFRRASTDS